MRSTLSTPWVEEVRALLAEDKLDGLLTVGHMEAMTMQEWQHARDAGVAVVQVGFRNPKIAPLCSVQPDYEVIGRTMAELIFSHIPLSAVWCSVPEIPNGSNMPASCRGLRIICRRTVRRTAFIWTIPAASAQRHRGTS